MISSSTSPDQARSGFETEKQLHSNSSPTSGTAAAEAAVAEPFVSKDLSPSAAEPVARMIIPPATPRELIGHCIYASPSTAVSPEVLEILRASPYRHVSEILERVDALHVQRDMLKTLLPRDRSEDEIRNELRSLSTNHRAEMKNSFQRMIHDLRTSTEYLTPLEHSRIAAGLQSGNVFGQHYRSWLVTTINNGSYDSGKLLPRSGVVWLSLAGTNPEPRDTILAIWPTLAATGFLPTSIEALKHELHHRDQVGGPLRRLLNLPPYLPIAPFMHLHINALALEIGAHLATAFDPSTKDGKGAGAVHSFLVDFERGGYGLPWDHSPLSITTAILHLYLLDAPESDIAMLVRGTRYRSAAASTKLLERAVDTLRAKQGLVDDEEFPFVLAARMAHKAASAEVERLKAQLIARAALEELRGKLSA